MVCLRHPSKWSWGWSVMLLLWMMPARAEPAIPVQEASLAITESTRARLLVYLARGDIAGAIAMYETHTGRVAPIWLKNLQSAYGVASQVSGKCQEVARTIHMAFTHLGKNPEYLASHSRQRNAYMVFELLSGKEVAVSRNGYHVAVRSGELIYDAYTGLVGMKLSDYLARLHAIQGVTWSVVDKP